MPINDFNGKKPKRRGGCLLGLLKFFFILILLICILIGILFYIGNKKEQEEIANREEMILTEDVSEYINETLEELKVEESDIVGLTKYDNLNIILD